MTRLLRLSMLVGAAAGVEIVAGYASPDRLLALGALLAGLIGLRLVED